MSDENERAANILEARGITKVFGGLVAVSSVDFDIPERSIVSLIGPNGAGKTTFFNMVSGLYEPPPGSFAFQGRDITSYGRTDGPDGHRAHLPEHPALRHHERRENVLAGMHTRLKGSILGSIFSLAGNAARGARGPREGRGAAGLRRHPRAGDVRQEPLVRGPAEAGDSARALASEPKLLLLDEPTAGMNPQETARLTDLIGRLREERGIAMLLIEHEMRVVMSISDRVTVLDHGEKISEGAPARGAPGPEGDRSLPRHGEDGLACRCSRLDNVHSYYGHIQALRGISLTVEEGEVVTLIGSNGAGKTTTLRSIHGILPPREGKIIFAGEEIQGVPPTT